MKWIKTEKGNLVNLERFSAIYVWSQNEKHYVCVESDGSHDENGDFYTKTISSFSSREEASNFMDLLNCHLGGLKIDKVNLEEKNA